VHESKTCFQVSGSVELHKEQVIWGKRVGPKNSCFLALPIYWLYRNLRMHVGCGSVIEGWVQKFVEVSGSMLGS
jgi:hypothetical protein